LIANHVPDPATHRLCVGLGFELFQGPHFSRQEPLPTAELPSSAAGALRLLALARDPNTPERELENALRTDPALTFQLLRLVNSAAGGGRGVDSISHALRLVGREAFARWLALAFAASRAGASGVDGELVQRAVERARLCELVAGEGRDKGAFFLVGLFSLIDMVLRVPLPEVLSRVALAPEVCEALLDRTGPLATALCFVEAYELGLWESAADYALQMGTPRDSVADLYAQSVAWAREQLASPQGASLKRAG
jgi:EAL and modified HD-GYP domain-containing signal transduction protein